MMASERPGMSQAMTSVNLDEINRAQADSPHRGPPKFGVESDTTSTPNVW